MKDKHLIEVRLKQLDQHLKILTEQKQELLQIKKELEDKSK